MKYIFLYTDSPVDLAIAHISDENFKMAGDSYYTFYGYDFVGGEFKDPFSVFKGKAGKTDIIDINSKFIHVADTKEKAIQKLVELIFE